jgi:hypothetical protein
MDGAENACESGEVVLCVADFEQTDLGEVMRPCAVLAINRTCPAVFKSIEFAQETLWNISAKRILVLNVDLDFWWP